MKDRLIIAFAVTAALLAPSVIQAQPVAPARAPRTDVEASREIAMPDKKLLNLAEAKSRYQGPLSRTVLEFLTVMDRVVNKDKQPAITKADWAPLGQLIDRDKFRRVGNFGVKNDWDSYAELLTQWANSSWWKGYVWRMREIPGASGQPGLVYLESEERSNQKHPVREDGDYATLASIAVYEIDANNKIIGLHVYDQRPM